MFTKWVCAASTIAIVVLLLPGCSEAPPPAAAPGTDPGMEAQGMTDEAKPDVRDETGGTGVTPGDVEQSRDVPFGWGQPSEKLDDESGEVTDETAGAGITTGKP